MKFKKSLTTKKKILILNIQQFLNSGPTLSQFGCTYTNSPIAFACILCQMFLDFTKETLLLLKPDLNAFTKQVTKNNKN